MSALNFSTVRCPACLDYLRLDISGMISCSGCEKTYPVVDDVPILLLDPSQDCALDLAEYDEQHPHDTSRSKEFYSMYQSAFAEAGVDGGACLEIGSGTGNITHGIVNYSNFSEIHCSDISSRFLVHLRDFIGHDPRMNYWIFDAARLPFADNAMSGVIGNSVLHHLLHYEDTLADVYRVLKPGGLAVFGEPIMEAHAMVSFLLAAIIQLERKFGLSGYSEAELEKMHSISRQQAFMGKSKRENRHALAPFEDKHALSVQDTIDLGHRLGFTKTMYVNSFATPDIGSSYRFELGGVLRLWGVDDTKLQPYDFLFQEFSATYGEALGPAIPVNYGYFKFQK